jgi:hypothetical protein
MKSLALAASAVFLLSTCAAYRAQHQSAAPAPRSTAAAAAPTAAAETRVAAAVAAEPINTRQAMLLSEVDKYMDELKADGKYDCCVKPACRQCALTAGECHCRAVISANGPCCGECTQSWVEGRGNTEGVSREQVLAHLGCVRELYEKPTPEGVTPPAQRKDQ